MKPSLPPADDSAVETWLREHAPLPALPGDDFTRRVMATLPPRRRRPGFRAVSIRLAAALGCAIAGWQIATGPVHAPSLAGWTDAAASITSALLATPILIACALVALSVVYANWPSLRRQLAL